MREVLDQLQSLQAAGERAAVATVVSTKRSAPRPLGSRLVVSESGDMTGSVSGGCVESDVALRAAEVLAGAPPMLVTYGITDDEAFDVGLPCGGEIEVFIAEADAEEVERVAAADAAGDRLAVTTVIAGENAGAKTYAPGEGHSSAAREGESTFVEHYAPPPLLLIFGAVDTAQHLPGSPSRWDSAPSCQTPAASSQPASGCPTPTTWWSAGRRWPMTATRPTTPPTWSRSPTTRALTSPRSARHCDRPCRTSARSAAAVPRIRAGAGC